MSRKLYDKYYLAKCPICGTIMSYNTKICPKCGFQIGKMAKNLRCILNFSYSHYGLYNKEFFDFKHDSCIKTIKSSDASYYNCFVLPELNIIIKKYLSRILLIEFKIDKFNNKPFNKESLIKKISQDKPYILHLILQLWEFAITDIKYVNKYYGGVMDYPQVRDFDSDTRSFLHIYYEFYRINRGHIGEKIFENKFNRYEKKLNNNFKYYIYHNNNVKDSFGVKLNTNNSTQLDTLIISNRGIFIPEMKNYSNKFHLDNQGNVKIDNHIQNEKKLDIHNNIMHQINNHETAMNKLVIDEFNYKPIPIYSFIVDVADNYDGNRYLPIYNINECIRFINSQPVVLRDRQDLEYLKKYVKCNLKKDKKYSHNVFSHEGIYFIGELLDYLDIVFKFYILGKSVYKTTM